MLRLISALFFLHIAVVFGAEKAVAQAQRDSGISARDMYNVCTEGTYRTDGEIPSHCLSYFFGLEHGIVATSALLALDLGYSSGDMNAGEFHSSVIRMAFGCLPDNISTGQQIRIFIQWVEANPTREHLSASASYMIASRESFPCE